VLRLFAQYDWTEYSRDQNVVISGLSQPIPQNWRDLKNGRLALAYMGMPYWIWRVGYAYASIVTPAEDARATFAAPGPGHSVTLGAGTSVGSNMELDGALEYSKDAGHGSTPGLAAPVNVAGDFEASAWVLHLGLNYRM